jgi:DNA-binding response OmpR family regulator
MSTASTSIDRPWSGGLRAAERLLVLLACRPGEAAELRSAWVGQAVDIEHSTDLGTVLYLAGRVSPDVIVIGTVDGALPVAEFLRALRQVDRSTPVVVGVAGRAAGAVQAGAPGVGAEDPQSTGAGTGVTRSVPLPLDAAAVLAAIEDCVGPESPFRTRPMLLDLGRLRVDGAGPRIWVDDVQCVIPPMEYLLLRYLAERPGQIISRTELASAAWDEPVTRHSNSLSVHVARLRRRFCDIAGEPWIRPVRGFGYQLTVPEARIPAAGQPRRSLQ